MSNDTKTEVEIFQRDRRHDVDVRIFRDPPTDIHCPEEIVVLAKSLAPAFYIDVGNVCNQNCVYCSVERRQLYRTRKQDALDNGLAAMRHGFSTCVLIGGEPTIWPPLFSVLEQLNTAGLMGTVLTTNGLMLSYKPYVEDLEKHAVHTVALSYDDWRRENQRNLSRRSDADDLLKEALANLARSPMQTYLYAVVTRHLKDQGKPFAHWFAHAAQTFKRKPYLLFAGLKPLERAHSHYGQLSLSLTDTAQVVKDAIKEAPDAAIAYRDIPLCLIPEHLGRSLDLYHQHASLDTASGETSPAALATDRKWAPQCSSCKMQETCPAIYETYLEQVGANEFTPF